MSLPADESRRLESRYSRMSNGEVENIAADFSSLTDVARAALEAEMQRRSSLQFSATKAEPVVGDPEVEFQRLVPVRKFRDLPEALLAKGSLDSAGIECHLADDNMVRMDWFISNLLGGIKLLVKPEDEEAATEILDQPIPEDFEVEGIGSYHSPECPQCGSLDVSFQELNKPVAYTTAWISIPIPVHRKAWKCHGCGSEWEDIDSMPVQEP
jgi:putative signal transducing protein